MQWIVRAEAGEFPQPLPCPMCYVSPRMIGGCTRDFGGREPLARPRQRQQAASRRPQCKLRSHVLLSKIPIPTGHTHSSHTDSTHVPKSVVSLCPNVCSYGRLRRSARGLSHYVLWARGTGHPPLVQGTNLPLHPTFTLFVCGAAYTPTHYWEAIIPQLSHASGKQAAVRSC